MKSTVNSWLGLAGFLIMIAKLCYVNGIFGDFVDNSMLVIDSAGPVSRKGMFQWFGFAGAFEWSPRDLLDQSVYSLQNSFVGSLPVEIVIPSVFRENEFQWIRLRSMPFPPSSSATDSMRRLVFLGDLSRYAVSSKAS